MRLRPKDIAAARSCEFLEDGPFSKSARENLTNALATLERLDVRIVEKGARAIMPGASITLDGRIRVSRGFSKKIPGQRAAILWHEIVHVHQRAKIGRHRFNAAYVIVPRRRWAFEMPAYRQSLVVHVYEGATDEDIEAYIDRVLGSFRRTYLLPMNQRDRELTREILSEELADARAKMRQAGST